MRLDDYDPNDNIRDLGRGGSGGGGFGGGGGGGGLGILFSLLPMLLGRRLGCGSLLIIAVVGFFLLNSGMLSLGSNVGAPAGQQPQGAAQACDTDAERWACNVYGSTLSVWEGIFQQEGQQLSAPKLNFFSQSAQSGCGAAQSAMGPFYCPSDNGIYLDTEFFRELSDRFGAAGDAAQAYVIAHEFGHHIQTVTGISDQVRAAQARASEAQGNAIQVKMELQADCYAGVWASKARTRDGRPALEEGDIAEAMRAAEAVGDDTLMRGAGQRVSPESFTHGSSAQRMQWLKRGLDSGDWRQCDTFG